MKPCHLLACLLVVLSPLSTRAEEVSLPSEGAELKGTLLTPPNTTRGPAVLIHPGSGPTDRDGNSTALPGKNNSLKYLAEALLQNNIASLRIDKRGIAASAKAGPAEKNLRFETYVTDTRRWLAWLKARGHHPVIMLGHSEGATIGMLASQSAQADAYISLAGPARPADEMILEQLARSPALLPASQKIIAQLKQGHTTDQIPASLQMLFRPSVQPYLISWFKYNPAVEIKKLKIPILIVQGDSDIQIPAKAAKTLQLAAPQAQSTTIVGMNHVLKQAKGSLQEQLPSYSDPKLPIHPSLVSRITQFIHQLKR